MKSTTRIAGILLILSGWITGGGWAQTDTRASTSYNIGLPSPNAASLGKFGEIPVHLSSGTPAVTIPLYRAESRHLSLPLRLKYHASGIRVSEIAGWAGLGWALEAGGVVTRTMRGLPDESTNGYLNAGDQTLSFVNNEFSLSQRKQYLRAVSEAELDAEPDLFTVSLPGLNARFMMDENGSVLLMPHRNLRVEPVMDGTAIEQWKITAEDGTEYFFGEQERTYTETINKTGSLDGAPPQNYVSSWYLTRIESAGASDEITISYTPASDTTETTIHTSSSRVNRVYTVTQGCPIDENDHTTRTTNRTYNRFPAKITTPDMEVTFNVSAGSGPMKTRLDSISIHSVASGALLRQFLFSYDTFGVQPRRMLTSVQEQGADGESKPAYRMEYYRREVLPPYNDLGIDHWGYYNGVTDNLSLIPEVSHPQHGTLSGADRTPDVRYMRAGSLKKIVYPTGGHTSLEYESNRYYDEVTGQNRPAGGLRLKKLTTHDGISAAGDRVKTYDYFSEVLPARSSGYLVGGPLVLYEDDLLADTNGNSDSCPAVIRRSTAEGVIGGEVVGYRFVREDIQGPSGTEGYSRHEFQYSLDAGRYNNAWKRGKLLRKTDYRSDDAKLQELVNSYTLNGKLLGGVWAVDVSVTWNALGDTTFEDTKFKFDSHLTYRNSETRRHYSGADSTRNLEVVTDYTYNTDSYPFQLIRKTETNSDGTRRITDFTYAHRVSDDGNGTSYLPMQTRHMLSQPYSVAIRDGNGKTLQKQWTLWRYESPTDRWLSDSRWIWTGGNPDGPEFNITN